MSAGTGFNQSGGGGGGGGTVMSVNSGTDITVDNTDPANPIVNFTGTYQDPITVVANYSALPAVGTVTGEFYWCSASQGTSWLPGSLGGTYYSAGLYYSNGVSWEFMDVPYQATQSEVNTGTNTNKFVTPDTFTNATKWATKQNVLSGTGLVYSTAGTISYYTTTGSGTVAALQTSPVFLVDITSPKHIGGTAKTSKIEYVASTAASPTSTAVAHSFFGGNNGTTSYGKMYHDGTWNFGNAAQNTLDTNAFRIGEGTAIVDIGAWRNDGASGVIIFNQTANDSGQYALRGNATTTVLNARSATVSLAINDSNILVGSFNRLLFQPTAATSGSSLSVPFYFYQPSSTGLTASTEVPCLIVDRAGTTQWSGGNLAFQRDIKILAPIYRATSASVFTDVATMGLLGAPIALTNMTFTNSHGLYIGSSNVVSTGGAATNSYGLTVNAQTGATNNYAAQFLGGTTIFGAAVRLKGYTVATLPATPVQGDMAFCTDLLAPTFLAVAVGGGAIVGKVFYNGTQWVTN